MSKPFSVFDLALLRKIGDGRVLAGQPELCAFVAESAAEIDRMQNENTRLRAVLSKCAIALGNGASIPIDAPIEDLEIFPLEVHAVVRRMSGGSMAHSRGTEQ